MKACQKAKDYFSVRYAGNSEADFFFVKCDGRLEKVLYDEVLFIEGSMNYVTIHTETRKMLVYLTLKSITDQLPAPRFLKVHKSFVVNIQKILSIEGCVMYLQGGKSLTVSHAMQEEVMKIILNGKLLKR
jgi:DNA-binding LytR/AlgR family response regulator